MSIPLSVTRLGRPQRCRVYDKTNPAGIALDYQDPKEDADHFCIEGSINRSIGKCASPSAIQVSIATLGLRPYLLRTIDHILESLRNDFSPLDPANLPSVVVVSNGSQADRSAQEEFLERFICSENCNIRVTLICTDTAGKSNAVNIAHQHATRGNAQRLIYIDDDLRVLPGTLARIHRELADGLPQFLGLATTPCQPNAVNSIETDIYSMTIAKRRSMGWPAPIGRFYAMPTSMFPTITRFDVYDDVFLSAAFMMNDVPQSVVTDIQGVYKPSSSLFEFLKRKRRIKRSDAKIVLALPEDVRRQFLESIIAPTPSVQLSKIDKSWIEVSRLLSEYAERICAFGEEEPSLNETDLSSKVGHDVELPSMYEGELVLEMRRLKREFRLA